MVTIQHQVWIDAPCSKVYEALSRTESMGRWWAPQTPVQTEAGLVLEHTAGPEHGVVRLKVLQQVPDRGVEWECISTHPESSPASGWTGTRIRFEISERKAPSWMAAAGASKMAVLDFHHSGWDETSEYLGFCSFAWGQVLQNLKQVCESPGT